MGVRKIGLFRKRKQEIRADTAESAILTFFDSNEQLSRSQAMEIPTVSACVSKIGEAVSRLPIKLYRKADGVVREITDDSRIDLLNRDTGDTLSTVDMWKAVTADYFLGRGAWIFVNSNGINVKSLHYVDCNNISILTNNDPIFKAFTIHVNERRFYDFQFMKLMRRTKDGFTNIPLQADNSKILSAAYNSLLLEKMMSANGGCKPGFIKAKTRLSKEAINQIKESYPEVYDNGDSSKKIVVLNDGVEFEAISSTAAELQMNENKKINSVEICKLFGFPHTIIDGGASESDKREFVAVVIDFLNQIETELDRCLLLESEKQDGYYWAFDTKELTRGSILERYQAYEIAVRNRFLQIDEVRQAEDYDPIGFNFVTLGLGDVLLNPQTLEVFTPNTGQSKNLLTGEERAFPMELRYNHNHDKRGRFTFSGGGSKFGLTKSIKSGIINTKDVKSVGISSIDSPIEQKHTGKGNPNAINTFGAELNNRQRQLLEQLPEFDSRTIVPKNSVNMTDLSALTAETGHEFAMFTKNGKRLVIRGNASMVNIDVESAIKLAKNGYKWSGHTHPGMDFNCLIASAGDKTILECFNQKTSVIYNSKGNFLTFERE